MQVGLTLTEAHDMPGTDLDWLIHIHGTVEEWKAKQHG